METDDQIYASAHAHKIEVHQPSSVTHVVEVATSFCYQSSRININTFGTTKYVIAASRTLNSFYLTFELLSCLFDCLQENTCFVCGGKRNFLFFFSSLSFFFFLLFFYFFIFFFLFFFLIIISFLFFFSYILYVCVSVCV